MNGRVKKERGGRREREGEKERDKDIYTHTHFLDKSQSRAASQFAQKTFIYKTPDIKITIIISWVDWADKMFPNSQSSQSTKSSRMSGSREAGRDKENSVECT